jgi:creatinine amidohydrolase
MTDNTEKSLAIIRERVTAIDAVLARTLADWPALAAEIRPLASRVSHWLVAGAGGSEGPARVMVTLLQGLGARAVFAPMSGFALDGSLVRTEGAGLVLFSQGLSPNAQLALARQEAFAAAILYTAVAPGDGGEPERLALAFQQRGGLVLRHGPAEESGLLVRFVGPAAATLLAMATAAELAGHEPPLSELRNALGGLAAARRRTRDALVPMREVERIALVTAGAGQGLAHGLRWKLLEALGLSDPPVWDVLQVAHGPFQQFYHQPMLLFGLEPPGSAALFDRLERMLVPSRHRLVRLRAESAAPACWLEHDAMLDELVIAYLEERPRDLIDWPGKGKDALLYRLGPA